MLPKIGEEYFDWLSWLSGSPADIMIICGSNHIINKKEIIKRHAIGYCDGERLNCRPKQDNKAVMFFKDGVLFWFHLTNCEFKEVFYEA